HAYGAKEEERDKRDPTVRMVERGAKLRDIAALWQLPMRLRRIKPGAVRLVSPVLITQPELLDHMPERLPLMRKWLWAVRHAADVNPDYAVWMARNTFEFADRAEIQNLTDWVNADLMIDLGLQDGRPPLRPFVSTMSAQTVRELSAQWHEEIA